MAIPAFYSADYRLSEFETFTYGISAQWKVHRRWWVEAGYRRYRMHGLDAATPESNYPEANVWSAGLRFAF